MEITHAGVTRTVLPAADKEVTTVSAAALERSYSAITHAGATRTASPAVDKEVTTVSAATLERSYSAIAHVVATPRARPAMAKRVLAAWTVSPGGFTRYNKSNAVALRATAKSA